jgi:hypothetical protein
MSTFEGQPTQEARDALLEVSGDRADGGELVGRDPREVPLGILSRYHQGKNPLKAIRERCLDCCCGVASEVRKCVSVNCPSWPYRMGTNPFREKRVLTEQQKLAMGQRLAASRTTTTMPPEANEAA